MKGAIKGRLGAAKKLGGKGGRLILGKWDSEYRPVFRYHATNLNPSWSRW